MKKTICFLFLLGAALCGAKEYFVSNAGNDKNEGSQERPFKTICKAVAMVKPGDVVTVRGGVYREMMDIRAAGTPEKPIVFRGAPGETALITGAYPIALVWKKAENTRFLY